MPLSDLPSALKARILRASQYKACDATPAGHAVLQDLLRFTLVMQETHVIGDPYETARNNGLRRVGLRIAHFLALDPVELVRRAEQEKDNASTSAQESQE